MNKCILDFPDNNCNDDGSDDGDYDNDDNKKETHSDDNGNDDDDDYYNDDNNKKETHKGRKASTKIVTGNKCNFIFLNWNICVWQKM